jgi:hypothetical protein
MGSSLELITDELTSTLVVDLFATGDIANKKFSIKPSDPVETAKRIAARELNAETFEELMGGTGSVIHAKDHLNKPFQLIKVEWQLSDIEGEGLPFYAILHIVDTNGEISVLTCGATSVCRRAAIIDANGWLGRWVKIVKESKTANGYEPLNLVAASEPEKSF